MLNRSPGRAIDREILALAWPALLALLAEPLFLLVDAAIVGRLGTAPLAGLGVAGVLLQTAVGLCVFLAYATTAGVARAVGAGRPREALESGVDGLWLAVAVGAGLTMGGLSATPTMVGWFDTDAAVATAAAEYLQVAWWGATPMLVLLAATGVLRGLADTRTPLAVTVAAGLLNIPLSLGLVYGAGWGIAGVAAGTVLAQAVAAAAASYVVVRHARAADASLRPRLAGLRRASRAGVPLLVRTLSLRAALVLMTWAATTLGTVPTATHQLATTVWTFLAFVLDAVAIAAQTVIGRALGSGDVPLARALTRRMLRWAVVSGLVTGAALAAAASLVGPLFSPDPEVRSLLATVLLVAAVFQPVAAVVFVLDGVLVGAGDGPYLAAAGVVVLAVFAPAVLVLTSVATPSAGTELVWLWAVFGALFIGGRAVTLLHRTRGNAWLVTGHHHRAH